jgi:hypothetical protein
MMLDRTSQAALLEALEELKRGSGRRFEDRLWLGFGDHWTRVRHLLLRDGCVREIPGDVPAYALEVRGEALRLRLAEALAPSTDASGTSVSVALAGSADS